MKMKSKHVSALLCMAVYFFAYLSLRWFCLCQTASGPLFAESEIDGMTGEQIEQAIEDWRTSRPIEYEGGIVGGSLRILFFPAALVDQIVTGRRSRFWGWSLKPYTIPKAENSEQSPAGDSKTRADGTGSGTPEE